MDASQIIDNRTIMQIFGVPMDDRHGRDVMVAIAKMTYAVSPQGEVSLPVKPAPVRLGDEPHSDRPEASIRYPSDFTDEKPGTDVIVLASAYPPADQTATFRDVRLQVFSGSRLGEGKEQTRLDKTVRVYGTRVWLRSAAGVAPGPAAPLKPTPIVYELAYGGYDDTDPENPVIDARNPAGRGVAADVNNLVDQPAMQLEDPSVTLGNGKRLPAGFGAIAVGWDPRRSFMGTMDEAWQRERAPLAPLDFDPRFNCCAPADQWLSTPLNGDETIELSGATSSGHWRFQLPRYAPRFIAVIRDQKQETNTHLDTFLIDADRGQVEVTWRTRVLIPRRANWLETIQVFAAAPLPEKLMNQARSHHRSEQQEDSP